MQKIGIYGGTFDPIHFGHLITAQSVFELRKLDKILFIPSFISPLKKDQISSSPEDRIKMLKLAIKDIPHFDYTDFEIKKKNISYTIETIKELRKTYQYIELIIGYDNLLVFDKWKNPYELLKLVKLVVLQRKVTDEKIRKNKYFKHAIFIKTPLIDISGTDIRQRVHSGKSINYLVPQKVMAYIYKQNLYKEK
jgi:nicotinate-nucleotide adenylyltransferase